MFPFLCSLYLTKAFYFLTENIRRIIFCDRDDPSSRILYKDVNSSPTADITSAQLLLDLKARDVNYFNGVLYWLSSDVQKGIGNMRDYDQNNQSYNFHEISQSVSLYHMHIAFVEP